MPDLRIQGRQLNQHPHIHVSVTRGGLDINHNTWRQLFFKKKEVEQIWHNAFVYLLRDNYAQINPGGLPGLGHIRNEDRWRRYLHAQYRRAWKVHFAKKTRGAVVHQYYDHRTQQHKRQKISQEEMLQRYVSHIPARHFKMVRYYGFLANRKRVSLLPKVYGALTMKPREKPQKQGGAVLMKAFLGTDQYQCILCKGRLRFAGAVASYHATKMLSDRLQRMAKKRWLLTPALHKFA